MLENDTILLAEDSENDVLLIKRAFSKGGLKSAIHVVRNGVEAIHYLKGQGKFARRSEYPLPGLMLLDLKMPILDGFEVLRWARKQQVLSALPILVLTSSDSLADVNVAYKLGANSFLVKPLEFENCAQLACMIQDYWLNHNRAGEIWQPDQTDPAEAYRDPNSKTWEY